MLMHVQEAALPKGTAVFAVLDGPRVLREDKARDYAGGGLEAGTAL